MFTEFPEIPGLDRNDPITKTILRIPIIVIIISDFAAVRYL